MKKLSALLLSLLFMLTFFAPAYAESEDGRENLVEVAWDGITSGPFCKATVTLYKYRSADPIDDEYRRMWGNFRLVTTDADGNVISDTVFDSASLTVEFTEPGEYYCAVYNQRGDKQGLSDINGEYIPLTQSFTVESGSEWTPYEDSAVSFKMFCDDYPDDHDMAFRKYLESVQMMCQDEGFSLVDCAAYLETTLADNYGQEYAALYSELRANKGYAVMEITSLNGYDPQILTEDDFWSGECWRYIAELSEIIFNDDGSMCPYNEYNGTGAQSDDTSDDSGENTENGENALPIIIGIGGTAAVAVIVAVTAIILSKKRAGNS